MRVTWIGGWGIAPESMRPVAEKHFAQSQHTFLAPTAKVFEESAQFQAFDLVVGWSLGAWQILEAASRGVAFPGMVLLFAPFVAFPSEAGLGGKCSTTQVKFLRRWLQREPLAALADFCKRAGIPSVVSAFNAQTNCESGRAHFKKDGEGFPLAQRERAGVRENAFNHPMLPYPLTDLLEGLDRLSEDAPPALREFAARGLPRNWQAVVGDHDPLLDGAAVCRALPGCVLLRGAGHAIADLLAASQAK